MKIRLPSITLTEATHSILLCCVASNYIHVSHLFKQIASIRLVHWQPSHSAVSPRLNDEDYRRGLCVYWGATPVHSLYSCSLCTVPVYREDTNEKICGLLEVFWCNKYQRKILFLKIVIFFFEVQSKSISLIYLPKSTRQPVWKRVHYSQKKLLHLSLSH